MLREMIKGRLAAHMLRLAETRPPDVIIGGVIRPYLERWHVIPRNAAGNVYLHHFLRSDDDRALHDHPWPSVSVILRGGYTEHTIRAGGIHVRTLRVAGDIVARTPRSAHRIDLEFGPCWTLFLTGPRVREWGFHCPGGWRHWRDFTNPSDGGRTIGRGCED